MPFPGWSSLGNQVLGEHSLPRWGTASYHLPGPGCLISQVRTLGVPSHVCHVSLGSWSLAATLLADVNCPGSQEDLVSNWEPARSLDRGCPLPYGSGCRLPASLSLAGDGWAGPLPASSPLVFAQSFVLWAAQQCLRLELFQGKLSLSLSCFFFFFLPPLSGYPTVWVAILRYLRTFRPGPYLKQCSLRLPV